MVVFILWSPSVARASLHDNSHRIHRLNHSHRRSEPSCYRYQNYPQRMSHTDSRRLLIFLIDIYKQFHFSRSTTGEVENTHGYRIRATRHHTVIYLRVINPCTSTGQVAAGMDRTGVVEFQIQTYSALVSQDRPMEQSGCHQLDSLLHSFAHL